VYVAAVILCFFPLAAPAQLPVARLSTIFPCGGQLGTTVEVDVTGQDLEDLRQLHFSTTNLTAKHLTGSKFSVSISSNAAVGIYDARAVGRFGISNPRSFAIGDRPEIVLAATNNSVASAAVVPINTVINGRVNSEAFQFFKFAASKGQRLLIECEAANLDSRLAPALILLDADSREIQTRNNGEIVDFVPGTDGDYLLKVHDVLFRGGPEYPYRVTISTRPHIDYVLPPTALAGTKTKLMLFGRNLPGGSAVSGLRIDGNAVEQLEVEIDVPIESGAGSSGSMLKPNAALVDGFEYRLSTEESKSNPVFISFAKAPVILEEELNNTPERAQHVSLPCEFAGQFYPANDRDWILFEAKKGETLWIEALSQRLGLSTDPFILIQRLSKNDKGEEQVSEIKEIYDPESPSGNEFKATGLDPNWRFEVKDDGTYRAQIRDLFNSHNDPRRIYRLSLRSQSPDFALIALAQPAGPPKKDSKEATVVVPFLRRGETIPIKVVALRREGFKGAIDLVAEGLPESISATRPHIEATNSSATLFLSATEKGPGWAGAFSIVGRGSTGTLEQVRSARGATTLWNVGDVSVEPAQTRLMRQLAVAVSDEEPAPIVIRVAKQKILETCVAGKLQVRLKIARHGDFTSALKLKAMGPGLEGTKEVDVDAKATNATVTLDLSQGKVSAGEYDLVWQTQATGKYTNEKPRDVTITAYSKPVRLKVAPGPVVLTEFASTNSVRAGEKLELPVAIKRLYGFEDAVELTLTAPEQLKGIKPAKASIAKKENETRLALQTVAKAPPGDYQFKLQAELKLNNQTLKIDRKIPIRIAAAEAEKAP